MITTKPIANGQYIMVFYRGLFSGIYHHTTRFVDIVNSI